MSKSQIDRLGERLKGGEPSEADLRMLDAYRRSFMEPYEFVMSVIRDKLNLQPTGRPAKSTTAIREKLRRESIRLTQMQDIAGCRIVTGNLLEQDRVVSALSAEFLKNDVVDPALKYGGGPENIRDMLAGISHSIALSEIADLRIVKLFESSKSMINPPAEFLEEIDALRRDIDKRLLDTNRLVEEALKIFH